MNLGEKINYLRAKNNMTLEELGTKVGVGKSTVRKWENGIIANMRRDKIAKLADALNTTPAYLMGWEKETAPVIPIEEYTNREKEHLKSYRRLFTADKDVVDKITNALLQTSYDMKSSP